MGTTTNDVLEAVRLLGSASVPQVRELVTGASDTTIASALLKHVNRGALLRTAEHTRGADGVRRRFYRYTLNPTPGSVGKTKPPAKPTPVGWQARLDAALAQITVLEAWKAAAIERYPNLGVDPKVLEARKIVAKVFRDAHDTNNAAAVESGAKDHSPIMLATLAALGD